MTEKIDKKKQTDIKAEDNDAGKTKIKWDGSKMVSNYANVCNVTSTREEFTMLFGTNQSWNAAQTELVVELTNRLIMNPYAAKRLSMILGGVVKEYESRFGSLEINAGDAPNK